MKDRVKKKADVKATAIRESIVKCMDDSFLRWISTTCMPRKFVMPQIEKYNGKTNPKKHVMTFKYLMNTCNIPPKVYKVVLCKAFSANLVGAA